MSPRRSAPLLLAAALSACPPCGPFEPPAGKRAAAFPVDRAQAGYLSPGDAVEIVVLLEAARADGAPEARSETLAPRAEVLRVKPRWSQESGLVQVALSPEELHWAALALDLERKLLFHRLAEPARGLRRSAPPPRAALEAGRRGVAVPVAADQVELLEPGRRADLVATRSGGRGAKEELLARTLVQDALVLGVSKPEAEEEWATVQISASPEQAKALAEALGAEDQFLAGARAQGDSGAAPVPPSRAGARFGRGEPASPRL